MLELAISSPIQAEAAMACTRLMDQGFHVIRGAQARALVAQTANDLHPHFENAAASTGPFYGANTRRFHGLLARSETIADYVAHPLILAVANTLLCECDHIQLNLTQAIQIDPGGEPQPPHRDQDMWPVHAPGVEYLINVMWPFTPYSAENGGTILWPGSHRRQDELVLPQSEAVVPELDAGDALLFLGSTLHAGGANITTIPRRGMIISYSLGWLKPYELPWLAYPPEIAKAFSRQVADLAGYRAHRPNLGTHEGRCPSFLLTGGGNALGAIDSLRPAQEELIAAYRRGDFDFPAGNFGGYAAEAAE